MDVGVSAKRIEMALNDRGIDPRSIGAVFITHEHSDHISGLRILVKRYGYPVYASAGTLEALLEAGVLQEGNTFGVITEEGMETASMVVKAFHTSHDSRESLGFRIHTWDGRKIAVATDMGYVSDTVRQALCGCDLVQLESNHDVNMLEVGPYPYQLKRRILSDKGHLSNEACAQELVALSQTGVTRFYLAHLSKENNRPEQAYITSHMAMEAGGLKENTDYVLRVAPRDATEPVLVF